MKVLQALSLKGLASKIHPPLSFNRRESQKLLLLLSQSFRQHLDREHPYGPSAKTTYTDQHFQSIFSNPLFNAEQKTTASRRPTHRKYGYTLEGVQELAQEPSPLQSFVDHMAAGTATISLARFCLAIQKRRLCLLPKEKAGSALKTSQTGAIMLSWLWSSGMETSLKFCSDKMFINLLMPFLVAEGREARVLQWLRYLSLKATTLTGQERSESMMIQSHIVKSLVFSQFEQRDGIVRAIESFVALVSQSTGGTLPDDVRKVYGPVGRKLVFRLVREELSPSLDQALFDTFVETTSKWSLLGSYYKALLLLHNTGGADPTCALHYIRSTNKGTIERMSPRMRKEMVLLCIDTAQVLFATYRELEAMSVMRFLEIHFVNETGSLQPGQKKWHPSPVGPGKSAEEDTFMHQLDSLTFG